MSQNIVLEMLSAYENAALCYVTAKLGLADLLSEGPRSSQELAKSTGAHADALQRVLRALVNRNLLFEESPGVFGLKPAAECLKSDAEGDIRGIAINIGELLYGSWGSLLYSVQTGKPAFEHIHGMKWFEYLKRHPESAQIFNRGMANNTLQIVEALLKAYDFSALRSIADIGGGQGVLLAELLKNYSQVEAVLFDSEEAITEASLLLSKANLLDRCQCVEGDFFQSVPAACDAYVLKSIIHDWDDAQAIQILKNCRAAMKNSSVILLIEPIMPEKVEEFSLAVEMDLGMLLLLNGRERTLLEYKNLYQAAGFELTRVIPVMEPFSIIEARPIQAD